MRNGLSKFSHKRNRQRNQVNLLRKKLSLKILFSLLQSRWTLLWTQTAQEAVQNHICLMGVDQQALKFSQALRATLHNRPILLLSPRLCNPQLAVDNFEIFSNLQSLRQSSKKLSSHQSKKRIKVLLWLTASTKSNARKPNSPKTSKVLLGTM